MATGLGETQRQTLLNYILRNGTFTPAGTFYISLHTADPGNDGQTANEVSGNNYSRVSVSANGGFTLGSAASPTYTLSNASTITFPTASGNWASSAALTHFGVWTASTGTTASTYVCRGTIQGGTGVIVLNTNTLSFSSGQLSTTLSTVTSGSTTGMGQAFRKSLFDYVFASTTSGVTDPLSGVTNLAVSLHTGDPGNAGSSNEVSSSGTNYARATVARNTSTFGSATAASPSVITNSGAAVTFNQNTGTNWGTCTFFGLFTSGGTFLLDGTITSTAITAGNVPSFATSTLTTSLDQT